jgi:hypothetical protein
MVIISICLTISLPIIRVDAVMHGGPPDGEYGIGIAAESVRQSPKMNSK